ncbi:MAG: AmmeMemoRadiSam system radical SAM enzyme [archaeon]|nr:AmmeMemoRadiSam system radical SAM enzyme [archaeon]
MVEKEGILWEPRNNGRIVCNACYRRCIIPNGSHGFCYVRKNVGGKLYLSVYGRLAAMQVDPIEKKPFNHFYPGTYIFTVGTVSCNWHCHPAGTKILLANGKTKNVEELKPNDALWSYDLDLENIQGSRPTPNIISEIRTREAELWEIWWGTQKRKKRKTLITGDHPVLTEAGWKFAKDIKRGDRVLRVWVNDSPQRKANQRLALFSCKKCGEILDGVLAWIVHRNKCYASEQVMPVHQRVANRHMMLTHNPMKLPEAVAKMKATVKFKLATDPNYGLHKNIERFRKSLHARPSKGQLILYEILNELGINYEREYVWKPLQQLLDSQNTYIMDAALLEQKIDVEVDGWWHFNDERIKSRDKIRDLTLRMNGWKVLRIPGSTIYNHAEQIKHLLLENIKLPVMENDKQWVQVLAVRSTGKITTVFGLECVPNHTYVADGLLVHNCLFCQNHSISKETEVYGEDVKPEQVPRLATMYDCQGVGFSYNEPTIFVEYVIDAAKAAHEKGKYTAFVTNGYGTEEAVRAIKGYVDAVVVDYKGNGEELFQKRQTMIVSAEPIKQTLLELKRQRIHTELTDLIIPQVGENLDEAGKLCKWLYDNLGPDVPIQFTAFHPDYKMLSVPPTPYELLEKHYKIAKKAGLNYVYVGNIPGNPYNHTYCPGCSEKAIERDGFTITGWNLDNKYNCKNCGYHIPVTGERAKRFRYREIEAIPIFSAGIS